MNTVHVSYALFSVCYIAYDYSTSLFNLPNRTEANISRTNKE